MLTKKRRYISIFLSAIGLCSALIFSFKYGQVVEPVPTQISLPFASPFNQSIAGSGIVEANTHNIAVGSNVSGIMTKLLVKEGDFVKKGDLLFVLDERVTVANIALSEKELITARTSFEIAKVTLAAELDKESRLRKLTQGFSVSIDAQQKQYFAVQRAKATVSNAEAIIASNIARLNVAKTSLNLLSVTAPLSGIILDIYMRPGEFININTSAKSVMLVGNIDPLYVKVQIDESDIHRFTSTALATAFLRNNEKITFPLEFVQALPYVTSKTQLNSAMPEIVDTRILYILYKIKTTSHKLYVGQLLDVFIQADNNY